MLARSRDCSTVLPLRKTVSALLFQIVDFWSCISCIVLDIELIDENAIRELGVFIDGKVQGNSFCPPKKYKPKNKPIRAQETCTDLCGTMGVWIRVSFQTFFLELYRVKSLQKEQKKARFLTIYWIEMWKVWMITSVLKLKNSLMRKSRFTPVTHSDTGPHFNVQSVRQNCLVTG